MFSQKQYPQYYQPSPRHPQHTRRVPQYYTPANEYEQEYDDEYSFHDPRAQYYGRPQRQPARQQRFFPQGFRVDDEYDAIDDREDYDALPYGYDSRVLNYQQRRQLEQLAYQQRLEKQRRVEEQRQVAEYQRLLRQQELLRRQQQQQQQQQLREQEEARRRKIAIEQERLRQLQLRARQQEQLDAAAALYSERDDSEDEDDSDAMDQDLPPFFFGNNRVDPRFMDPSTLQKLREEQQRKQFLRQQQQQQQIRNTRARAAFQQQQQQQQQQQHQQVPVAAVPLKSPQKPRLSPQELLLNSVVKIQTAVRAFLVRKQKLIPKLREISATRAKVQSVIDQNEGLLDTVTAATTFEKKTKTAVLLFEEELTRALISLDGLSVGGSELVRDARKALVRDIQGVLSKIDPVKTHYKKLETEATAQTAPASEPASPTLTPAPVSVSPVELPSSSVSIPIIEDVSSSSVIEAVSEEVEQESLVSEDAMVQVRDYDEHEDSDHEEQEEDEAEGTTTKDIDKIVEPEVNDYLSDVVMTESAHDPTATVTIEDADGCDNTNDACDDHNEHYEESSSAGPSPITDGFYFVPVHEEIPSLKQMCRARVQSVMKAMSGNRVSFDDIHNGRASLNIVA